MKFTNPKNVTADQLTADFHALYGGHRDKAYNRAKYLLEMPLRSGAPVCELEMRLLRNHGITKSKQAKSPDAPSYGDYRAHVLTLARQLGTFTHSDMVEAAWMKVGAKSKPHGIDQLLRLLKTHKNAVTAALRYWVEDGEITNNGESYTTKP